ncbi:competence/damage-inducible protein A [Bacillus sp. HMF5848]|uniref:competence/damage-inducible protein A n=1 Tax=Bacillus sp. HMF5848 TaxID=2495421 RepID=UPI000F7B44CD|nr:competence/damage-inducible protein A [Bacillus sp. HMF5848]RSK27098.1 competence/damage-inducible protein A [Bacillus sp. HMF5848]
MNAEIIAVGSELLLGQIVNSNAQFLSTELAQLGINVYFHTVVGDNSSRLEQAIGIAKQRSNLLIFTGGLGPTKDDITKEIVAKNIHKQLQINDKALSTIEEYYERVNRIMSPNNRKQALVIEGATVFHNHNGMAPGMAIYDDGITYMLLPGPPKEMKPMFVKYGRDYLQQCLGRSEKLYTRVLRFYGIGESQLETEIEDLIDNQTNPTIAPLAADYEVTLRLTAKHEDEQAAIMLLDQTEKKIAARCGQFLYGYDDSTLANETFLYLQKNNLTIASAESLTGGAFLEGLIKLPGASSVVKGGFITYTREMKQQLLGISTEVITNEGVVSEACAFEMATQAKKLCKTDVGISFTGVAGPDSLEGKPAGLVYIGLATEEQTTVYKLQLAGSRNAIRERASKFGYYYLLKNNFNA